MITEFTNINLIQESSSEKSFETQTCLLYFVLTFRNYNCTF